MERQTFKKIFKTILVGNKKESREARKSVRKFLYSSNQGMDRSNDINNTLKNAPREYCEILEDWRQENFVAAISSIYFLRDDKNRPDFLFPWLFFLLQHKNGNTRYYAVRTIENELGTLTYHIRFPEKKSEFSSVSPEIADEILFELFLKLNVLFSNNWNPIYKKYKYIDALPSGIYKSAQMLLSNLEDRCGKKYVKKMKIMLDELLQ